MLLNIIFLHLLFCRKQFKLICVNIIQIAYFYSILFSYNCFFLLVLQRFNYAISRRVKPNASFIFKLKIPSKTIFNLILLEIVTLIQCLKFIKDCSFYNFCKVEKNYMVLRAPFVFKNSREQFCVDHYIGQFLTVFFRTNFLIVDFIEMCVFKKLKRFIGLEVQGIKKLT